jgi:hypothetical protein
MNPPVSHELWRLRGATDDLRGLAVETSFGFALALELAGEVILLHLQPSLGALVVFAWRLEIALRAQGWQSPSRMSVSYQEVQ